MELPVPPIVTYEPAAVMPFWQLLMATELIAATELPASRMPWLKPEITR